MIRQAEQMCHFGVEAAPPAPVPAGPRLAAGDEGGGADEARAVRPIGRPADALLEARGEEIVDPGAMSTPVSARSSRGAAPTRAALDALTSPAGAPLTATRIGPPQWETRS